MRRYLLLVLFFSLSLCGTAIAQTISNAPEQNCPGAIPVCQGDYLQTNAYSGEGTIEEVSTQYCPGGNNGALGSQERNGVWYVINVVCDGFFSFTIMPLVGTEDYDWACWNITGGGCSLIYNYTTNMPNAYPPYGGYCTPPPANNGASNFAGNLGIGGWTGLTQNPTLLLNGQFNPSFYVTAGQTFALLVSNYSSSVHGYRLTFDSSTACLHDTIPPTFKAAYAKCGYTANTVTVDMSVPVKCSTIDADGSNYRVTPAPSNGAVITSASSPLCISLTGTSSFTVQFSKVLPAGTYWLHAQNGDIDHNTVTDFCGNTQPQTDSVEFVMNPPNPPIVSRLDTPACVKARLIFDRGVKCSSVALDGSNFLITGPDTIKLREALPVGCNDDGLVDTVDIFYTQAVVKPGKYTIKFVAGTNGQLIADTCGEVVVSAPPLYVSDGGVHASAYPNLLCAPGYFNLGAATIMLPPPPPIASCGANGTACNNGTNYQAGSGNIALDTALNPLGGSNSQRRTRMLYTAAELKALGLTSGTFSALAFNVLIKNTTQPFFNLTLKMGCTADSLLDTTLDHPGAFSPSLEIVYGPKNYSTTTGWNYFPLDNTYDWDSSRNLLVEMCYSDTSSIGDDFLQGSMMPNMTYSNSTNTTTTPGCELGTPGGHMDSTRPNMQFVYCPADTNRKLNWVWTPNNYLDYGLTDSTSAFALQTTTYTATIIDNYYCYRRDTALLTISVRDPQLAPLDTALCIGNSVTVFAAGGTTYKWYPATGLSCSTCANPTVTIDTTTLFHVGIYDKYKCGDTLAATVVMHRLPLVTVTPKDTVALFQVPVQLEAYSGGARYYVWQPTTGLDNPNIPNPQAQPDSNMVYIVTVTDTNNCSNSDSLYIRIYEQGVEIPSAFTPNGDGKNDVFRVANLTSQKVAEFRVFNRWGQQIYDGQNANKGWDGTYNGIAQDIGTYNYLIRVVFHDGSMKTFTGSVTLIR